MVAMDDDVGSEGKFASSICCLVILCTWPDIGTVHTDGVSVVCLLGGVSRYDTMR